MDNNTALDAKKVMHEDFYHFEISPRFFKISSSHVGHSTTIKTLDMCRICFQNLHDSLKKPRQRAKSTYRTQNQMPETRFKTRKGKEPTVENQIQIYFISDLEEQNLLQLCLFIVISLYKSNSVASFKHTDSAALCLISRFQHGI